MRRVTSRDGCTPLALRLIVYFYDESVGADGYPSAREWDHHIIFAGAMRGINDNG